MFDFYHALSQNDQFKFIIVTMLFLHIIADYIVQTPFMAEFKQKKSWEKYNKKGDYKHDYKAILLAHAFSWAFITFFPLLVVFKSMLAYSIVLIINTYIHYRIDDLKCNKFKINLIEDQALHMTQILFTYVIICLLLSR